LDGFRIVYDYLVLDFRGKYESVTYSRSHDNPKHN